MRHREKVAYLVADLRQRGVNPNTTAPPLFRLLWALGMNVRPPLFLGFLTLTIAMGSFFGFAWGLIMWLIQWQFWRVPVGIAALVSLAAGLAFGLCMAAYYRWKAKRLGLPSWEVYCTSIPDREWKN